MTLNNKSNELTELERDVLDCLGAETGTYYEESWITENYTKAKNKEFAGVCSSLIQKGICKKVQLNSREAYLKLTEYGFEFIDKEAEHFAWNEFLDDKARGRA